MPIKNDKINVNYRNSSFNTQKEVIGELMNRIIFKKSDIKSKKETLCIGLRNWGRKLDGMSCYISFQPEDKKLLLSKYNRLWNKNPNKQVWITPKGDAYVFYKMVIPRREVIVLPLKVSIPKKKEKYDLRIEINSKSTAKSLIKADFVVEVE